MTLMDRARTLLARFQRKPGWPDPPKDETHANYRRQYETLLPTLKHLPRGDSYEERQAYLFLAEILIGLHNYGDDPIMPPGVRRIVERVQAEELPPVLVPRQNARLARFVGPLAGIQMWVGVGALALFLGVLGWWRVEVAMLKGARDHACTRHELQGETTRRPCVDLANVNRNLTVRTVERDNAQAALVGARRSATASREAALAADRRAAESAARERRRNREIRQVDAGGPPPDWERSLRDDESVQPGAAAAGGGDTIGGNRP
jgi:hypothetical protein